MSKYFNKVLLFFLFCLIISSFSGLTLQAQNINNNNKQQNTEPKRDVVKFGENFLSFQMINAKVFQFEISVNEPDKTTDIGLSPMIDSQNVKRILPRQSAGNTWNTSAAVIRVQNNPPALLIEEKKGEDFYETAFVISPYQPDGQLAGLNFFANRYTNLLGAAADFYQSAAGLNLIGQTILPGGPFGNQSITNVNNKSNQVQAPIIYALGTEKTSSALFVDETRPLIWDFQGTEWSSSLAGPLGPDNSIRFFVILGSDLPEIRTSYMSLIGHTALPPQNAFTLWVSGLKTDKLNEEFLSGLRALKHNIPEVSNLILNINETNLDNFPFEFFKTNNLSITLKDSPYISTQSSSYADLNNKGFLVKDGLNSSKPAKFTYNNIENAAIDFSNRDAGNYWFNLLPNRFIEKGIYSFRLQNSTLKHLSPNALYNGSFYQEQEANIQLTSRYVWGNRYSFAWINSYLNGLNSKRNRSAQQPRLFFNAESGLPGLGRLGGSLYSEVFSLYNHRISNIAQTQLALSGFDYYSFDLENYIENNEENLENDIPMIEAWLAQHIFTNVPLNLPQQLLLKSSALQQNVKLRNNLSPYYYTLALKANEYGEPFVSPLAFYFQDDLQARDRYQEIMIGKYLLVAGELRANAEQISVYVPQGRWYNLHNGDKIEQEIGGLVDISCRVGGQLTPPILARAGAIIPSVTKQKHENKEATTIQVLQVFTGTGNKNSIQLQEDDGTSKAYLDGNKFLINIEMETIAEEGTVVRISATGKMPNKGPKSKQFLFDLHGLENPGAISLNNLPYDRVGNLAAFDERESAWISTTKGRVQFKTPPLNLEDKHELWIK